MSSYSKHSKDSSDPDHDPKTTSQDLEAWRHFAADGSPQLLPAAQQALKKGTPNVHRALRALGSPERVRVALALAKARLRGAQKFSWADQLLADPEGVEVATPERLAKLKARRFGQRGTPMLVDLACGIGGDGRALSRVGGRYLGLELDPRRCLMARHNTGAEVLQWDLRDGLPEGMAGEGAPGRNTLFHFDPLRRSGGRRLRGLGGLEPFVGLLHKLCKSTQGGGLKLGPDLRREDLEALGLPEFTLEFLADAGGVVQAVAWFGALREEGVPLRATRLLGEARAGEIGELRSFAGKAAPVPHPAPTGAGIKPYLLLPDPLLDHAGLALARLLDQGIQAQELHAGLGLYLAPEATEDPWFSRFEILAQLPLREKKIKAWLRAHDGGRVTVRTRGKAVAPETWVKKLEGRGSTHYTLFMLRLGQELRCWIAS